MKKIICLLMLGVFASFAACSDDDDDNSGQTINVAGSDFTVYGIDSYYSQAMEQFVIGFMLHKEMIVNNDIYFELGWPEYSSPACRGPVFEPPICQPNAAIRP